MHKNLHFKMIPTNLLQNNSQKLKQCSANTQKLHLRFQSKQSTASKALFTFYNRKVLFLGREKAIEKRWNFAVIQSLLERYNKNLFRWMIGSPHNRPFKWMAKGEESRISLALIYRTDSDRWSRTCRKDNKMNLLRAWNMQ